MRHLVIVIIILVSFITIGCKQIIIKNEKLCLLPDGGLYTQLIDSGKFITPYLYRALPNGNMLFINDGIAMALEDTTLILYKLLTNRQPSDIHWSNDGICLFADSTNIYNITTSNKKKLFINTNNQNIKFQFNMDSGLYYYHEKDSILYFFSYKYHEFIPLYIANKQINDFKLERNDCFLAVGKEILLVSQSNDIYSIFKSTDTIQAIELGDDGGIFYGTRKSMGYFNHDNIHLPIINKGVKALIKNKNSLYVTFNDNSSARIDSISGYTIIADSLFILNQ